MKRSDATKIISAILNPHVNESPDKLAITILSRLIEAGMRPPERYESDMDRYYGNDRGWEKEIIINKEQV